MPFVRLFFYSNTYVALLLFAFTLHSFELDLQSGLDYSLFIGFGSWAVYSGHTLFGLRYIPKEHFSDRHRWVQRFKPLLLFTVIVGLIGSGIILFSNTSWVLYLLPAILVTSLYLLPSGGRRLRDIPYLKLILVTVVVFYLCRWFPQQLTQSEHMALSDLLCIAFLFLLTLPFDLRDRNFETQLSGKNFVEQWGERGSQHVILFGLLTCILVAFWLNRFSEAMALSFALAAFLIPRRSRGELFYPIFFEGPLLLMAVLDLAFPVTAQ